jgi:hypothetical protein
VKISTLTVLASSLLLAPFAMAASTPPVSGVLITQVDSQKWQIRLITADTVERFSGVMESDQPITGVQGVWLESSDSAKLLTPNSLGATLAAWPGRSDGVKFTVGAGATLCLRDTGSSGVKFYRGATLQDAVPVTAPVALAGTNACGTTTPPPPPPPDERKFHPGHWIAMIRGVATQALMQESIKPGVVGFVKRYTWRSLEPSQGVYQFSEIKSDLAWAAANGMRLIVMIEDRTYRLEKAGPAYLDGYEQPTDSGGYTLERWQPAVVSAWIKMIQALGKQFDSHPNLEGVATQETSLGFSSSVLQATGFTPEKYRDSYISILSAASAALPTSRVFWFMNFFHGKQSYIGDIAAAVASKGVVMGGPDVWPDNESLATLTYPFYTQFQGKMPLFGQVEPLCYGEPHMTSGYNTKYWTMPELFNYARTKMHVNYMFWVRVTRPVPADSYTWANALPVIAANPSFSP